MSIIDVAINDSKEIQSALRSLTIFESPKKAHKTKPMFNIG